MRLLCSLVVLAALPMKFPFAVQAQSSQALDRNWSSIRWCLPETRDDPAKIISGRCRVYKECLDDLELDVWVDQRPFPSLSKSKVEGLKRCHQALYNTARANPRVRGSKATQDWLEHDVVPGSEALHFAVPASFPDPR